MPATIGDGFLGGDGWRASSISPAGLSCARLLFDLSELYDDGFTVDCRLLCVTRSTVEFLTGSATQVGHTAAVEVGCDEAGVAPGPDISD